MFLTIQDGDFCIVDKVSDWDLQDGQELIGLVSYENMEKMSHALEVPVSVLEEARRFGYVKYDSFEDFDCVSMELMDFHHILLSQGSVILYMEKNRALFFTAQMDCVEKILMENAVSLGEKITLNRMVYSFLEQQTSEDHYIFEKLEQDIMELEESLITSKKSDCVAEIINLRKQLMVLKRYYEQMLNALDILGENENDIFDEKTLRAFKLLERRAERRFHSIQNLRDAVTQARESYEAEVDISLNKTMKLFTVVTTIFLPLTLIVGWYGMNFNMPEYGMKWGYPMVIFFSVAFVVAGIIYFKKNKWF